MQIEFTETERQAIEYERYHHPHPHVQRKMEVLWLKSLGKTEAESAQIANVSQRSIAIWPSTEKVASKR